MVLIHNGMTLASQVVFANSIVRQMLGLMFRKSISDDFAMIFTFKHPVTVGVHMLCMRFPIDTIFLDNDKTIIHIASLRPWVGHARVKGVQYFIEMNQGMAERSGLAIGDTVSF